MKLSGSRPYVYFKVKSPLRIPITTKNPFNVTLSVHGLQPIKIQWQKDQHELMIGSRYKTFENGRRLLVEPPYTVEDSGTYSASACNSKGCGARGFQVIFYGEGFVAKWMKKFGFLGIPIFLVIILVIAIACTAGSGKPKEKKGTKVQKFREEIHVQGHSGARGGRTASLWSWQSEGESRSSSADDDDDDDMPDYDKLKYKKSSKKRHHHSRHMKHDTYSEIPDYEDGNFEREDTRNHGQQHYSNEEIIYDTAEYRNNRQPQAIDSDDGIDYDTVEDKRNRNDVGNYDTMDDIRHYGSRGDYNNDDARLDKDSDVHINIDEEHDESIYASYHGHVLSGIQPMRAHVVQTEQPAQATRATTVTHDNEQYDFLYIPDVIEFD
ncbi:hypothetical protein OS493_021295 [Desmophyllum pertusum]|uniref:Uncharacterized protein n=1 Tax=Desmophyllum pertusum TaxID=174260 RepID=A0A9W9ZDK2_9CNID|nr:hypothetical protein OS493_021295 [Desmophyllum pertusum]